MPNSSKRLLLSAILTAGVACAVAAAPAKPKPAAKPKPVAPSTATVRPRSMPAIAAQPRVPVRIAARPAPKPRVAVRTVTAPRRTTTRSSRSAAAARRLANQPGMGRRGAFSSAPMNSKSALMAELRRNASLRRNLARHFRVKEADLIAYIDQHLKFERLPKSRRSVVMGVSKAGKLFSVRQTLPAGTPVFCLYDKTPIMKSICGNPIVFKLPPVPRPVPQTGPIKPPGVLTVEVRPETVPGRPTLPGTLPLTAYAVPLVDTELPPTFAVTTESGMVGTLDWIPGERRRRRGGMFPWWIAGAGIPFFFLDDDDDEGRRLIPEPNSIVLFAAGGVPLAAWLRKRRRKDEDEETEVETADPA